MRELPDEDPLPVAADEPRLGPNPVVVFSSGRHTDAEIVRSLLAGCGIAARVWASGMAPYTGHGLIGQLTGTRAELAGYRVMVRSEDAELASDLIAAAPVAASDLPGEEPR